jgi:hypothetical protein
LIFRTKTDKYIEFVGFFVCWRTISPNCDVIGVDITHIQNLYGFNLNAQLMRHIISKILLFIGIIKPINVASTPNQPDFRQIVNEDIFKDDNDLGYC